MRLEVAECDESNRVEGDPECRPDEEIDEWLKNKKLVVKFIDQKIKFMPVDPVDADNENNLMRTERLDTISLMEGLHTVDEHQFRRNEFVKMDSIWYFGQKTQIFYDYVFVTAKTFTTFNSRKLATVDFSLSST